ncbi:unnamed protein product [Caenorhabditis bovis]|uniref:Uncharacterized protein n=1 Tax=Caenorhabditis bovis TaxID=2654633 RepID=A0A8S1EKX0_9PELO|nr:unnamed protein product [Caenorhabditis bovis]
MKPKTYEILSAAVLGFGQLCILTGYNAEGFILESVIHSIHERNPSLISQYAGYYGQAICYAGYMITCLFSSSLIIMTNAKIVLFIAAICFTLFPIGFLFTNQYYFFISCAINGIGFALFYQGQGLYLASHSTRNSIEFNVAVSWAIGSFCFIIVTGITSVITSLAFDDIPLQNDISSNFTNPKFERKYSDSEITLLFSVFALISALGCVFFGLLPNEDVENCIENSSAKHGSPFEQFKTTCKTLIDPNMIKLFPLFCLVGSNISLFLSILPTSFQFNRHNSHMIYIPAVYSFGLGLGEILMGIFISIMSKRVKDFSLRPTLIVAVVGIFIDSTIILASTPYDASMRPTNEHSPIINQSYFIIILLGFILGVVDNCLNTVRGVICTLSMPNRRSQAHSVSKLIQAGTSCLIFFLSPSLSIYYYTIGFPILGVLTVLLFLPVSRRTRKMERRITTENLSKASAKVLCSVVLGFGQLCIMTGFNAECFILESVIHSIHERSPSLISHYAGYYGQAICYAGYMITSLFSASLVTLTMFYQGQGSYLAAHSTRDTIQSNVAISWSIGCFCYLIGSAILGGITIYSVGDVPIENVILNGTLTKIERRYTVRCRITGKLLFGIFAIFAVFGGIFFGLLPSEDVEGCIESGTKRGTPFDEFKATCATLIEPQMLKLFPLFALCGANMSFFLSILPTSLQFNMNNTEMVYLLAIYSFGIGIGEILTGFFISAMSKKIKDFALQPTLSIAVVCLCTYCGLVLASTPYDAPMRPTHEQPLLFQQSQLFILILAVIIGIVDNCINTVRGVICTLSMPSRRTQAHAISKLVQAASSCTIFFISPILNIYYYTFGLPILAVFTSFLFFHVSRRTQKMERRITTENLSKAAGKC